MRLQLLHGMGRIAVVLCLLLLGSAQALAQGAGGGKTFSTATAVDMQRFQPAMHSFGMFRVESAKVSTGLAPQGFIVFNHAGNPVVDPSGGTKLVKSLGTLNILANLAFAEHGSFAIDLPLHMYRSGIDPISGGDLKGFTLGDIRASIKGALFEPRRNKIGFGLQLDVGIPTGGNDKYTDEEGLYIEPKLLLEARSDLIRVLLNSTVRQRFKDLPAGFDSQYKTEMRHLVGIGIFPPGIDDQVEVILEVAFATSLQKPFTDESTYLETGGGVKYIHTSGLMFGAGGSVGSLDGYGVPSFRIWGTLGYQKQEYLPEDSDGDGILDDDDKCPQDPEDMDSFEDGDGCPDLDNDQDGILDAADQCPNEPEDMDGVSDEDGCPDPDTDGDGLDDPIDKCPNEAEDADGFQDEDGCPDLDNDQDGLADAQDKCPNDAEDKDNIQDEDGCPETDADADSIPDETDKCPLEAENINGCEDSDGCPEAKKVCVGDKKIVITEKIFFATGRARILKKSDDLLEEIAQVILNHPEIELIEVQGHTDSRGSSRYNKRLSRKRAKAVYKRITRKLGVPRKRISYKGYGEDVPIADNETDEGRAKNRRVEFIILKQRKPNQ